MSTLPISVALCTYNGGPYLEAQLESIRHQTLAPAEVIICDDGSTDDTVTIARAFAAATTFPVHVTVNPANLGSTKNFEQAIALCSGEIIALSDQDDVWADQKLEILTQALAGTPNVGYVFSDLLDWSGYPTDRATKTMWQQGGFRSSHFRQMSALQQVRDLLKFDRVTGATMAFWARYKSYILPISPVWFHDGWIALLLTCLGQRGVPIDQPLICYRRHAEQQTAVGREKLSQRVKRSRAVKSAAYLRQAQRFTDIRSRLQTIRPGLAIEDYDDICALLTEKERHLLARADLHTKPPLLRAAPFVREFATGRYLKYSDTWPCVVKDLLF